MSDAPEVIRVAYDCTAAELSGAFAYLAQFKKRPGGRPQSHQKTHAGSVVLLIMLLALAHVLQTNGYLQQVDSASPLSWSMDRQFALGMFGVGALLIAFGRRKLRSEKRDDEDPSRRPIYELNETGIRSESPGRSTALSWRLAVGFDETADLFIVRFYDGPLVFPKRLFDAEQQARVRGLFVKHLARPAVPQAIGFEVKHP